jgi:hypothetical protein
MLKLKKLMCWVAVTFVGTAMLLGCTSQDPSQSGTGATSATHWKEGLDKDVVTALSQLSADDRPAALAQKVCPVTDQPLGSMGKPPKITVEGQQLFLCCQGCDEQLLKEPAKFLAKLKSK